MTLDTKGLGKVKVPAAESQDLKDPVIGIRPERFVLTAKKPARKSAVQVKISEFAYYGEGTYFYVAAEGRDDPLMVSASNDSDSSTFGAGDKVWLSWAPDAVVLLE